MLYICFICGDAFDDIEQAELTIDYWNYATCTKCEETRTGREIRLMSMQRDEEG
jgi:DNA-directed RNA polymerase subunit RPC12/RpoP